MTSLALQFPTSLPLSQGSQPRCCAPKCGLVVVLHVWRKMTLKVLVLVNCRCGWAVPEVCSLSYCRAFTSFLVLSQTEHRHRLQDIV